MQGIITSFFSLTLFSSLIFSNNLVSAESTTESKKPKTITTSSGLKYEDQVVGTGILAEKGKAVSVKYTGWLDKKGEKDKQFSSSEAIGKPITFPLGTGRVIKGWDEGIQGMKVGGRRTLMVPSKLAYGAKPFENLVPANSNLIFEIELLEVTEALQK